MVVVRKMLIHGDELPRELDEIGRAPKDGEVIVTQVR